MPPTARRLAAVSVALSVAALAACSAPSSARHSAAPSTPSATSPAPTSSSATPSPSTTQPSTSAHPSSSSSSTSHHRHKSVAPASGAPVIVIDPGHSRTINATDPSTGLNVSDYENEPEMRDVFAVALIVRAKLQDAGYRVVMTKNSVDQRRSLGQRAQIARDAHADLAISIHDQAGGNGGIGFRAGNNIVYYQSVGTYRATSSGRKIYFTDGHLAALSKKYGEVFATQRRRVENTPIALQGSTGYNLGGRGLAAGDIWMVQLLGGVPWIYNESGGNSSGRSGLDSSDEHTYAAALVAGVEHCIPPPR